MDKNDKKWVVYILYQETDDNWNVYSSVTPIGVYDTSEEAAAVAKDAQREIDELCREWDALKKKMWDEVYDFPDEVSDLIDELDESFTNKSKYVFWDYASNLQHMTVDHEIVVRPQQQPA